MNAHCIICADLFSPRSEIYTTNCGHLFHYVCLIQWIGRSKTCPQCRHKETEKTIHRVYFNIQITEHVPEDIVTLQAKLDNKNFNLSLKQKDISNYTEKYEKCKISGYGLKEEMFKLQQRQQAHQDDMRGMKEKLFYFKEKLKDKEKCIQEIKRLQREIEHTGYVREVVDGCENQVLDILKENKDPKSLCTLVVALQKELAEIDRKSEKLRLQITTNKKDLNEVKSQANIAKKQYEELKKLVAVHENCPAKIASLKQELSDILTRTKDANVNDSISRAIYESPAPLRPDLNAGFVDIPDDSPTVTERVAQIKSSDSPYLPIKMAGTGYGNLLQAKFTVKSKTAVTATTRASDVDKYSIFNKHLLSTQSKGDFNYNGLGGHSKVEMFPQPKKTIALKRSKSNTMLQSTLKFRKLTADAGISSARPK